MKIYGLPSEDRTEIIEERRLDSKKLLNVPWSDRPILHPTEGNYIAAGWLLEVVPIRGDFQRQGEVIIGEVEGEYTYELDDWTQEEIQVKEAADAFAAELEEARQKLRDLVTEYPAAVYFLTKTNEEINTSVNGIFNTSAASSLNNLALACRAANKQQSEAIRDLGQILKGMIKENLQEDVVT